MRFVLIVKAEQGFLVGLLVLLLLSCGNALSNSFSSAVFLIVLICKRGRALSYLSSLHQHCTGRQRCVALRCRSVHKWSETKELLSFQKPSSLSKPPVAATLLHNAEKWQDRLKQQALVPVICASLTTLRSGLLTYFGLTTKAQSRSMPLFLRTPNMCKVRTLRQSTCLQ